VARGLSTIPDTISLGYLGGACGTNHDLRRPTPRRRQLNHDNATFNEDVTIGEYPEGDVTPAVEWTNVDPDILSEAIEQVKFGEFSEKNLRIGTINRTGVDEDTGRRYEIGVVLLKGLPSDDEVVAVAGRRREWDDE